MWNVIGVCPVYNLHPKKKTIMKKMLSLYRQKKAQLSCQQIFIQLSSSTKKNMNLPAIYIKMYYCVVDDGVTSLKSVCPSVIVHRTSYKVFHLSKAVGYNHTRDMSLNSQHKFDLICKAFLFTCVILRRFSDVTRPYYSYLI